MTIRTGRRRTAAGILAATLAAAVALAGCSAGSADSAGGGGAGSDNAARDASLYAEAGAPAGAPAPEAKPGEPQQAPTKVKLADRSIIYTGSMSVRVENVEDKADQAIGIAVGAGGLVGGDQRTLDAERSRVQLILRIPAAQFNTVMDALAGLGTEESRDVATQDVTEAVVDLDVRLASQQASVARVQALMARAQTVGEVVSVEAELNKREAELASLKARKDKLADLVALSTITVIFLGPAAPAPEAAETGFLAGLSSGWNGFLKSVEVVLTVAGWLIPWVVAIGVPVWLVLWLLRRRRRPVLATAGPSVPATFGLPQAPPSDDAPQS